MSEIGWSFPPTNGGRVDGFNDPGIATFNGAPLSSLARETIQNSLDAGSQLGPVDVSFELFKLGMNDEFGRDELDESIRLCIEEAGRASDAKARNTLENARTILANKEVPVLRISDSKTTGLQGDLWKALVKMQGLSQKGSETAGGSHGVGKYAPFAVSPLRTVFYWSCFEENEEKIERFQGKAVLMSHQSDAGETQGTGFYGLMDGCESIGGNFPLKFRNVGKSGEPLIGTVLSILGFPEAHWQDEIARNVLVNFFPAISWGTLTVTIDPEGTNRDDLFIIDKANIEKWFSDLRDNDADIEEDSLAEAELFYKLLSGPNPVEKEDPDFGHIRLWIRVADGLPSKVAMVRQTGMVITMQQKGLLRFSGLQDFIALCHFDAEKGNALLRDMENVAHTQFEVSRLSEDKQKRGERALNRITKWIREEIRKVASPPDTGRRTLLRELRTLLPDMEPDDDFGDGEGDSGDGELAFDGQPVIRLKPRRRRVWSGSEGEEVLADEDEDGGNLGDGGGSGNGNGDNGGPGGTTAGTKRRMMVSVRDVRVIPVPGAELRFRVGFTPESDAVARIVLTEAGDTGGIPRSDLHYSLDGVPFPERGIPLRRGERTHFEFTGDEPIDGRAWRLVVYGEDES